MDLEKQLVIHGPDKFELIEESESGNCKLIKAKAKDGDRYVIVDAQNNFRVKRLNINLNYHAALHVNIGRSLPHLHGQGWPVPDGSGRHGPMHGLRGHALASAAIHRGLCRHV